MAFRLKSSSRPCDPHVWTGNVCRVAPYENTSDSERCSHTRPHCLPCLVVAYYPLPAWSSATYNRHHSRQLCRHRAVPACLNTRTCAHRLTTHCIECVSKRTSRRAQMSIGTVANCKCDEREHDAWAVHMAHNDTTLVAGLRHAHGFAYRAARSRIATASIRQSTSVDRSRSLCSTRSRLPLATTLHHHQQNN
jgi:hypothetical protein